MSDPATPTLLEGIAPFAQHAVDLVRGTRNELALLSQNLDPRAWCTEAFTDAVRKFVLQHSHTRFRLLISNTQQAIAGGSRLIELGRKLSSFVEFRELAPERRQFIREEYLIGDGRVMLYREDPSDLESKYYAGAPSVALLKLKDFDQLWHESTTAQELRDLKL